jgi:hypothetical protein
MKKANSRLQGREANMAKCKRILHILQLDFVRHAMVHFIFCGFKNQPKDTSDW